MPRKIMAAVGGGHVRLGRSVPVGLVRKRAIAFAQGFKRFDTGGDLAD